MFQEGIILFESLVDKYYDFRYLMIGLFWGRRNKMIMASNFWEQSNTYYSENHFIDIYLM